ncbi:MAG: vWA domain-containing protein [Planctomycetota bacterium]|jgi:uncharacterized protein YegL
MSTIARPLWLVLLVYFLGSSSVPLFAGNNDHVVIVLDDSGSMREVMKRDRRSRIDAAKSSLKKVIEQIAPETNVGLLLLNGARASNHWYIPIGPVNQQDAIQRIDALKAGGGTPLGDALRIASDELLALRAKKIYGTYRLIVVTDGEATDQALLDQYLPDILSRGIIIDAIGVDMRGNHSLATKVHSYRRADDQASLSNAIQEIMAERNATDQSGGQEDFAMLDGLGDLDVAEVLKALSKPNNEKVTGIAIQQETPGANGNLGNLPNNIPAPWTPSNSGGAITSNPTSRPQSIVSAIFSTICTCCVPLLVILFFVSAFLTASKNKQNRRR